FHISAQDRHRSLGEYECGVRAQPVDSLKWNFLLLSFQQVKSRIGEIQRSIGAHNDVVRAIKPLPFKAVGKRRILPIRTHADYRSQYACAIDKPLLLIEGIAIRISEREHGLLLSIQINAIDLILRFVADVEKTSSVPYRTLRESKTGRYRGELCVAVDQVPECGRLRDELEFSRLLIVLLCGRRKCGYQSRYQRASVF